MLPKDELQIIWDLLNEIYSQRVLSENEAALYIKIKHMRESK